MSDVTHSPGPWRGDGPKIIDSNNAYVGAFVFVGRGDFALALAAPELLAALERLVGADLTYFRGTVCEGQISFEAVQAARAAVAKAKGIA